MIQTPKWRFRTEWRGRFAGLAMALLLSGCVTGGSLREPVAEPPVAGHTHELLHSILWTQTAVERRALALQSYRRAAEMLDRALADPSWTAALEQSGNFSELPPAVILDVDETVLDNSAYEARLILEGGVYNRESWTAWCREEQALPVPGALEFTRHAVEKGVTVFYVTNRRLDVEDATRNNLNALGFPIDLETDTLLTRGERQAWEGSGKSPRREEVASRYRVLLLIGDNLGDFLSREESSLAERDSLYEEHRDYWGTRWIVLPNPQYGSWEGALFGFDYRLSDAERLRRKYEALQTR